MLCLLVSLLTISKEAAWVIGAMDEEDGGYTAQVLIQRGKSQPPSRSIDYLYCLRTHSAKLRPVIELV